MPLGAEGTERCSWWSQQGSQAAVPLTVRVPGRAETGDGIRDKPGNTLSD